MAAALIDSLLDSPVRVDDDLLLRIEKRTFADESFGRHDPGGLIVLGQVPNWMDLRWHSALVEKCGADLKWANVRSRWQELSHDLRQSVVRNVRDALITIVDPSLYRFDVEQSITNAVRRAKNSWSPAFSAWVEAQLADYEKGRILLDSPAVQIQGFLEDDGLTLGDVRGIQGNSRVRSANPRASMSSSIRRRSSVIAHLR